MNNEYIEKLKNLDQKSWLYIFIGVLVFVFLLDYLLLMRPQLGALAKVSPEIEILKDNIVSAKKEMQSIEQYRTQVQDLTDDVERMNNRVHTREEIPLILEYISSVAHQHQFKVKKITPNPVEESILLENDERIYSLMPITLQGVCGYHQFGRFINQLENSEKFFIIGDFTMAARDKAKTHSIDLIVNAVVYEEHQPEAAE